MELAIDTSTSVASVALALEGRPLAEITWQAGHRPSASLLPQIQHLLVLQSAAMSDLRVIAVALGPGSFNGLRAGLGTAKGLCLALAVPLIGVGTLEVAAYPFAPTGQPICPVQEAGRDEVAVALYQGKRGGSARPVRWRCLQPPRLLTREELPRWAPQRALFCGEPGVETLGLLHEACGEARVLTGALAQRRAAVLAEIAWEHWQAGQVEDLDRVEPLYLRRPPITPPRVPIRRQDPS